MTECITESQKFYGEDRINSRPGVTAYGKRFKVTKHMNKRRKKYT